MCAFLYKNTKLFAYVIFFLYLCTQIREIGRSRKNIRDMRKQILLVLLAGMSLAGWAQKQNETYLAYINEWKDVAIQNQADYGIPASIIMAQALLESAAGQSELARKANNHFGIKCTSDWMGPSYHYSDNKRNDCFRKYKNAADSYKDHALFLQRSRYAPCFEIAVEDYEGWANKLRECGYATDKQYAPKLVKIIEDYRLDLLGKGKPVGKYEGADGTRQASAAGKQNSESKGGKKATVVHQKEAIAVISHDPEPEYVEPPTAREERKRFFALHTRQRQNGLRYVVAREEDTYANVAFRLNVRERDLREHNDALGMDMKAGDRIYLSAKKKKGSNVYTWSHPGQSLWQLSQDEGVTMEAIRKYNELDPSVRVFTIRQKIYLKKVKEK